METTIPLIAELTLLFKPPGNILKKDPLPGHKTSDKWGFQ